MECGKFLVRLDAEVLSGVGLNYYEPYPDEMVVSGRSDHERYDFHDRELFVGAYKAEPVKLLLTDYPQDEFMYLLSGRIIIRDDNGLSEEFGPGEALVLKKGFSGTFEMQGSVRKIAVMCGDGNTSLIS